MKHKTYEILYQAHLGDVDKKALQEARKEEEDPFNRNLIDLVLEQTNVRVPWDVTPFTQQFRSGSPRERLDETVFAFILRIVAIIKEEMYMRSFQKPESHVAVMAWENILHRIVLCTMALLYDVRWTVESVYDFLDPAVMKMLHGGDPHALRTLMGQLGISDIRETPYQGERLLERLNFLHVGQYSSFFWRYLHWMAEAFKIRTGAEFYKKEWLDIFNGPLYRTLRCGICMFHFKEMLEKVKLDNDSDLAKVLFEMHNRVHAQRREQYPYLKEPDYTESEYREDAAFMIQALSP